MIVGSGRVWVELDGRREIVDCRLDLVEVNAGDRAIVEDIGPAFDGQRGGVVGNALGIAAQFQQCVAAVIDRGQIVGIHGQQRIEILHGALIAADRRQGSPTNAISHCDA